jgi:hypothetical protein
MCFKIYAFEEVETKGKMTRDSVIGGRDSTFSNRNIFDGRGNILRNLLIKFRLNNYARKQLPSAKNR